VVTKNDNQRKQSDEFMQEVVSINEALVRKVQLLQEKERSRLKDRDNKMRPTLLKGTTASSGKENDPKYGSPKRDNSFNLNVSQSAAKRIKATVGSYVVARPKLSKNLSMSKLGKEIDRQREVLTDKVIPSDSLGNTIRTQSAASLKSTPRDTVKKAPSPLRKTTGFEQSFGKGEIKKSIKKPVNIARDELTVEEKVTQMFEVEETLLMPVAKITDMGAEECSQIVFRLERELAEKGRQ